MFLFAAAHPAKLPGLELPGNNQVPWTIVFTLTLLTLLPALLLSMTPMVRLLVVFHFLRQALGTQTAPSNQTLMGLGLFMTWFLMQPVLVAVNQQAVEPFRQGQISGWEAIERGSDPPRRFMLKYAREKDLALFSAAALTSTAGAARGPAAAGGGARVHSVGVEGRLSDRGGAVSAVSAGGSGDRFDYDFDWHVSTAAGGVVHAAQDSAVCDGGRLEPAGGFVAEEFLTPFGDGGAR